MESIQEQSPDVSQVEGSNRGRGLFDLDLLLRMTTMRNGMQLETFSLILLYFCVSGTYVQQSWGKALAANGVYDTAFEDLNGDLETLLSFTLPDVYRGVLDDRMIKSKPNTHNSWPNTHKSAKNYACSSCSLSFCYQAPRNKHQATCSLNAASSSSAVVVLPQSSTTRQRAGRVTPKAARTRVIDTLYAMTSLTPLL